MADHGLTLEKLPTMQWEWIPEPPLPLNQALPATVFTDQVLFRSNRCTELERIAFQFSFPQLFRQTPDPHFYRLIQVLNTPLLCLNSRDMGRSDFAYWQGVMPKVLMRESHLYVWFFRDQNDQDLIVAEYGFDGSFSLRTDKKPADQLQAFYLKICKHVNEPR